MKTACWILLIFSTLSGVATAQATSTIRGDANSNGAIEVADIFYLINHLFAGGTAPVRTCLGDANSDQSLTAADVFFLLNHLFAAAAPPVQATEVCNSRDDDCDGQIDEGVSSTFFRDQDGDGYGTVSNPVTACTAPTGYVTTNGDCNDTNPLVHPAAMETCNGVDDNCNIAVDEGVLTTFYRDVDGDGYGTAATSTQACTAPTGYVANSSDCNDANPAINPGAAEICDGNDNNCSGATDEGLACAIHVSTSGDDLSSDCSAVAPCRTVTRGLSVAAVRSRTMVILQTGTYTESIALIDGVTIEGGYSATWQRGDHNNPAFATSIVGAVTAPYVTVSAANFVRGSTILNLKLVGATPPAGSGASTYVVHALNSKLTVEDVVFQQGDVADGATGTAGLDAVSLAPAPNGGTGGNGAEFTTSCNNTSHGAGGAGGMNACTASPSSRNMNAGRGGDGGEMDTDCNIFNLNASARNGRAGANAAFTVGSAGQGGVAGPANSAGCNAGGGTPGGNGGNGVVANGSAGSGASGGSIASNYWVSNSGGPGSVGENGGGGGGGGGAGGCDDGIDAYGAGGGGGGAGGCAARGGGGGGQGGGASFGIFAINSTITATRCLFQRGAGGKGGDGATGGQGQPGGPGELGGFHPGASAAGAGASGGHGGHGGGGGGGAGGYSVGIMRQGGTLTTTDCPFMGGTAGAGGAGGSSAPSAPLAQRDGNNGTAGSVGIVADIFP